MILIRMFRTKIIFHLHGKGVKEKIKNPVLKFLYTWFFYNQFIILLSPLLFDDIREVAIKSRISYLPNGIDIGVKNNKRHRIESDRPFKILFLSNLVPTKGPTDLIEACKILKEKNSLFQLYFVGTPSSKDFGWEKLDRLIRLYGLDKQTHYLGPKYGNQKDDILCDSDVLVFPTVKDCFPLVILEAMAFGLPVISTYEGAIPEIVDDGVTGYLVPPKNPERIAEKLLDLINNPETRIRMGEAAKKKFEQHYTLNQFNSKLIGVIDAITRDSF
ncbi:MAG: glycosyltransferase family 4 protein [Thermodesulfobacteriota bacterium]|nr:MAG: glycosyltransferase family 4 protein [Thermodesulfobacteriota bacterium]